MSSPNSARQTRTDSPPSRRATGVGRPYRAEVVAAARALFEGTVLPCGEIAEWIGVCRESVERWSRRFGWRRMSCASKPGAPAGEAASGMQGRHPGRYGAEQREAARALIEGTRLGWERIAVQLGVAPCTLWRWQRRYRWTRPPPPDTKPASPARYRTIRGRPYAADAVGTARHLVSASRLSLSRIAVQVGVSVGTMSRWTARRGWSRPPDAPPCGAALPARRAGRGNAAGQRRRHACPPEVVEQARELFQGTELPAALIAARVGINKNTVWLWAKRRGWTRPRDQPDPQGRVRRRRRRAGSSRTS